MPKVLLVEDDRDVAGLIKQWLESENYSLDIAHEGNIGYEHIRQGHYDIIVLDWELPGISGLEICRRYRTGGGTTPVLMLTAKDLVDEKATALDAGADDYLTKPFHMKELSARLRALARRSSVSASNVLKVGHLELDPVKHLLFSDGQAVHLVPKDFALLEFLMRHPDEVFSTEALMQRVWGLDSETSSGALRTAIGRLRQNLDKSEEENDSIIENMRGIGYRLRARR